MSCRGNSFSVYADNPFNQPCTALCSAGHSSDSGRLKISWGGETSDKYLVQDPDCLVDARKFLNLTVRAPTSFPVMDVSLAFFEHPTPVTFIFFVHCTFTTYCNNLLVNFSRMNIFSFWKSYHLSHFISMASLNFCVNFERLQLMGKNYDAVLGNTHIPLDIRKATKLYWKCARHLRGRYLWSVLAFQTRLLLSSALYICAHTHVGM